MVSKQEKSHCAVLAAFFSRQVQKQQYVDAHTVWDYLDSSVNTMAIVEQMTQEGMLKRLRKSDRYKLTKKGIERLVELVKHMQT